MTPYRRLFSLFLLITFLFIASQSQAQSKKSQAATDPSKKVGFSGDPARKRGMEIGFDMGKKAGKSDKEQDLKPDLKRHEAYQEPDKYYRSEYGSRASFSAGFRSGFSGGYQAAFGKKVNISPEGSSLKGTKTETSPKKGGGHASDAF